MILVLNQFSENDPAPTSRYLKEWVDTLRSEGQSVVWIHGTSNYREKRSSLFLRFFRELNSLFQLLYQGILAPSPHLIVTSSSPPGILIIAVLLKLWHRVPLIHWAMDLHPDLSKALHEKPPMFRLLRLLIAYSYSLSDSVWTLDESMRRHLRSEYQIDAKITSLWPLHSPKKHISPLSPPRWIYSGNLGKAHDWKSLIETQHQLEKRGSPFTLRFQGNAAQRFSLLISLPRQIEFLDFVNEEDLVNELLKAHILVATQNPSTTGLLWPCKLALLSILPRPMLWIGSKSSSISKYFSQRPHTGIFQPHESVLIADWIERYQALPLENEYEKWIANQPTKAVFLEQARREISRLLNRSA